MTTGDLLLAIARCHEISKALADETHPCSRVVLHQKADGYANLHVPEPWNGRIETAPILFISSNPSYNPKEEFPAVGDSDASIRRFFEERFEQGGPAAKYLQEIRRRAAEIVPDPRPGVDYAVTEVVHCKSRDRIGVIEASSLCTRNWLAAVLSQSGAVVVAVVGKDACRAVRRHLALVDQPVHHLDAGGRHWLFLGGIGSPNVRKLSKLLDEPTLEAVRNSAGLRLAPDSAG